MAISLVERGTDPGVIKDQTTNTSPKNVGTIPVVDREVVQYTITAIACDLTSNPDGGSITKIVTVALAGGNAVIMGTEVLVASQASLGISLTLGVSAQNLTIAVTNSDGGTVDWTIFISKFRTSSA